MKVRVDGDIIVYAAGFACERTLYTYEYPDGRKVVFDSASALKKAEPDADKSLITKEKIVEPVEHAYYNVRSMIRSSAEAVGGTVDDVVVYLSGSTNFRDKLATIKPYKGNRDPTLKPVHAAAIKDMIRREYEFVVSDGVEADDAIATDHYADWLRDEYSTVLVTLDKDLDMVPGLHYNPRKDRAYMVDEREAAWNFHKQLLTGDAVDNIPGIPKVGPKTAEKILPPIGATDEELLTAVIPYYKKEYGDEWEDVLFQIGNLLWIRVEQDKWWTPKQLDQSGEDEVDASVPDAPEREASPDHVGDSAELDGESSNP